MVSVKSGTDDLGLVQRILNPEQMSLFMLMQPGEKEHAISMVRKLSEQGETQPDLLVAALLHDVGKVRYRLNLMERAIVVLAYAVIPRQAHQWGSLAPDEWEDLPGWRRPFVVAEQHATWGAESARRVGVSQITEKLIREHHHPYLSNTDEVDNSLLHKLWIVDNES